MRLNAAANHLRSSFVGPQLFYHKPIGVLLYLLPEHTCQVFNLFTGLTYQIRTALNYGMTSLTAEALTRVRIQSTHGFEKKKINLKGIPADALAGSFQFTWAVKGN